MKVLLDTHCFLWWISAKEKLNAEAARILARGENTVYFSAASAWEIAIKASTGKLGLPEPPPSFVPARVAEQAMTPLPIDQVHALPARRPRRRGAVPPPASKRRGRRRGP